MPAGESVIDATVNGAPARRTVRVDGNTAKRLQEDLEAANARSEAGKAARPCGYFDHRAGAASFRPVRFLDGGSRGVLLEVELTEAGRKALEGGDYAYFSPAFKRDRATGEVTGLRDDTVEVGSFVNDPAFQSIEAIAAARAMEEEAEGEENVYTARPLAFSKEKPGKKTPPAEFYEDDEEGDEKEETENPDAPEPEEPEDKEASFIERWKKHVAAYNPSKKKPASKEEPTEAGRTFLQVWGQHQAEQVAASNPYGCNQYGEGWKNPHNGTSTTRGADGKKKVKSDGNSPNGVDSGGKKSVNGGAMKKESAKTKLEKASKKTENARVALNTVFNKMYTASSLKEKLKLQEKVDELRKKYEKAIEEEVNLKNASKTPKKENPDSSEAKSNETATAKSKTQDAREADKAKKTAAVNTNKSISVKDMNADQLDTEQKRKAEPLNKAEKRTQEALKKAGDAYKKHGGDSAEFKKAMAHVDAMQEEEDKERKIYNEWYKKDALPRWNQLS